MLDVRRVHVDAAHDDHVVAPPAQAPDPRRRPAAAARLEGDRRDVAGAVAEHRHRLLEQRREDELALDALVERRTRVRIDDLDEEVVLVDVEAVAHLEALGRDSRPAHLGEPVEVDRPEPGQRPLDLARAGPSVHGSPPNRPSSSCSAAGSIPASCTACAITSAYDGVATSTCAPRSCRSIACRAVKPPETGRTGAPIRSAPWWKPWPPVNRP